MQRILITGGAGFIGSNLAKLYLDRQEKVFVIDNLLTGSKTNVEPFLLNNNFKFINEDLLNLDLKKLFKGYHFDLIFHLASPASPKQYIRHPLETLLVNSAGTNEILRFAVDSGCQKIIYASTSEVYGDPKVHPQTESYWGNVNPTGPRSCYDEAKRFGEALCMTYWRKYNLNISIARIFNTFGPNMEKDDGRVISNFIVQALSASPMTVYGSGKQTRSFCYVSDLVDFLDLMSKVEIAGEIINVGNPEEIKIIEIARLIKKMTNSSSRIVFNSLPEDDPKRRKPDITKASNILGWQPKLSLKDGLDKTIKYFKMRFNL